MATQDMKKAVNPGRSAAGRKVPRRPLPQVAPFCEEKTRFVANYAAAVAAYYACIRDLEEGMIAGSNEIYRERRQAAEEARLLCDAARQDLDDHLGEHDC